jgi:hypothetical protein
LAASEAAAPIIARITNGGFEDTDAGPFAWQVNSVVQAQAGSDTARKHGGNKSLRVNFRATNKLDWANVTQLVAVDAGKRYRLEGFAYADSLKSAGPPLMQVLDAATNQVLASSAPLAQGTAKGWQPIMVSFTARGEGIIVRLARESCGTESLCPIFGTVWFDDFSLQAQ